MQKTDKGWKSGCQNYWKNGLKFLTDKVGWCLPFMPEVKKSKTFLKDLCS